MPFDPDDLADPHERHRLSTLMLAVTDDDSVRHEPPPDLWDSLARRLAHDNDPVVTDVDAPPRVVTDLESRRHHRAAGPRAVFLLAAAGILLVTAIGSTILVGSRQPSERVVAQATLRQLEPLGTTTASARLVTKDGTTRLVVDAKDMPPAPAGEAYELWLVDTKVSDPRSLGVVTGSEEVTVPASIDPATHPIVDISLEPDDGNHRHSGHSLMRGTLN